MLSIRDARPYMSKYQPEDGDMHEGIRVAGKDAGIALLHDVATSMASAALADAKSALEHSDIRDAQASLKRDKAYQADPALIQQLELQLNMLLRKAVPVEGLTGQRHVGM